MDKICSDNRCSGCGACVCVCPETCMVLEEDAQGFAVPVIDTSRCINCARCVAVCPECKSAHTAEPAGPEQEPLRVYVAISGSQSLLKRSSSGGVFSVLAEAVLEQSGVVFGAALSEDGMRLAHRGIQDEQSLDALRRSKYLYSDTGTTFRQVREFLENDRMVLYAGTPCQIAGLRAYLDAMETQARNLLCVEVVCHGVPSMKVWRAYLRKRLAVSASRAHEQCVTDDKPKVLVNFRDKRYGWSGYGISIGSYYASHETDPYLHGYLRGLFLRGSCHDCRHKGLQSSADITLGDFWGIRHLHAGLDTRGGCSMVIVRTKKGLHAMEGVREAFELCDVSYADACKCNSAVVKSARLHEARMVFLSAMEAEERVVELLGQHCPVTLKDRLRAVYNNLR